MSQAAQLEVCVVTLARLVFFSTDTGNAWLLDPEEGLALRLAAEGRRLGVKIVETAARYVIEWTARYHFEDESW